MACQRRNRAVALLAAARGGIARWANRATGLVTRREGALPPGLTMQPVSHSPAVAAAGYDPQRRTLAVQFRASKNIYTYSGVPPGLANRFLADKRKGRFFHRHIRRRYKTTRVVTQ